MQSRTPAIEIVKVTASKRSESVQDVPGQVTALTDSFLAEQHDNSFADFAASVPGLSYASGGPTNNLIAIRGVTTGGSQLGSAVGLYLDDVPLGASTQFGLGFQSFNVNLFDLDRVEVLNGPQGTLYGSNALGGAIRYITKSPDLDTFSARGEIEGSDTGHSSDNDALRGMVNVPLLDGKAAIRVVGLQQFDSGYAQDPTHGRKDVGSARTLGGRISFLAQINEDVDIRLSAYLQGISAMGSDVALRDPVSHAAAAGPYDQSYALAQPSLNTVSVYSGVIDWNLQWAKLTSITGYQRNYGSYKSDLSTFYDGLFGIEDFFFGAFGINDNFTDPYGLPVHTSTKKLTQEVRLTSPDNNTFEWVVGGYFDHEITDESVDLVDGATANGTIPAGYTGAGSLPFYGYLPSSYREFAVYADGTYFLTDDFDVTLGIRYSNQHQEYQSNISSVLIPVAYAPTPSTVYHYKSFANQSVETYLINPRYHISDDTMVYARVSSGFRPGGPNFVLPGGTLPATFQPDTLWNYELGEKSTLFDGKGILNVDIYDIEWTSMQATENVDGINQLVNAGNARIKGAEGSFDFAVSPNLSLSGSAAYTDAALTTMAPVLGVTYTGARLPLSPKYNFALSATYSFDISNGYSGAVNVSDDYVGDRTTGYKGSVTQPVYVLPAYNTVNVNLSFDMPNNMELDGYVKNVFDVQGQVSGSTLNNALYPSAPVPVELSQPRTVGIVLKAWMGK
ncbi:MAG: TonB-dependent receptor [Alphaproteobacteria bacterium]|nr:TonB-dependent receptor [Alphaproteobacteria bacterium]MDE2492761.1 TonB-dependent receptor [Alphaproteobacteria bacterium]